MFDKKPPTQEEIEVINQAIHDLDDTNPAHWNKKGQPNLNHVREQVGLPKSPSRKQVDEINNRRRLKQDPSQEGGTGEPISPVPEPDLQGEIMVKLVRIECDDGKKVYGVGDVISLPAAQAIGLIEAGDVEAVR